MNPIAHLFISLTILMGTMIAMFSSHWFLIWMGLELNMLAIVPTLAKSTNPRSTEASTKYFLVQATASMIFLMITLLNYLSSGQWTINPFLHQTLSTTMLIALMMKLGMAPLHFWLPEVTQGIPLTPTMLILTWQKLAPMSIITQIYPSMNLNILLTISILSIMAGSWGGLNQTQLRKILAYSSITHMGWMMAVLFHDPNITVLNLLIYILLTIPTLLIFNLNSNMTILSLSHTWNKFTWVMPMFPMMMMSLGGLPPLTGFSPKWAIMQELTKNSNPTLPLTIAMLTLMNLYFYMRLTYSISMTMFPSSNNTKINWQLKHMKLTPLMAPLMISSMFLLPTMPLMLLT
uniref:NADH-ubiquinone oxidoreductase chain 2 n=2 Tax=Saimiri oerstedii TaxID=70928 RepID=F6KVV5_SAIOE|nr:NADH dehydrogenase subunit 2 [Saimiri oerstedii citrinellus]YP_010409753.1 NADH dehydrogenase subunit 2 [Saimiri oerstedii]ADU78043.1 NADH dehydrogenase subunit 2 [Saimiri oerstedii oerstedii]ADU78017.1 NADH dehydrogenase subunit 2 [Saimiri oerstedii citrinellus]ADU78030.1 NADH dehydrogenase subunit 2 [Saimiri oerstedii citrinellus]URH14560.1 NADH dehydrogenase subunit 2 [Saimiri oerstedii]